MVLVDRGDAVFVYIPVAGQYLRENHPRGLQVLGKATSKAQQTPQSALLARHSRRR